MAKTITRPPPLLIISLLAASLSSISANCTFPSPSPPNVKGMFVFGSSYVDNGNNNFLAHSYAKANYTPYGIDFALGPSGRFTNGKNVIDLLGEELGLPYYLPVFNSPSTRGSKILYGVDFASAASGILDDTGSFLGVTSLRQQIKNFEEVTLVELEKQLRCQSKESLRNYLFVMGAGGNDYSLNYFPKRNSDKTFKVSPQAFTANLTTSLSLQIKKLYHLGARKFVLMSLYPIGCSPGIKASASNPNHCVETYNKAVQLFNAQQKLLVNEFKTKLPGSNLVYVNAYKVIRDIIRNPDSKGFIDASNACCEVDLTPEGKKGSRCTEGGSTCANRNTHAYFDGTHPTEAVNKLISKSAYSSNRTTQVYPFNIKQLARI